jgi:hypothetical protein
MDQPVRYTTAQGYKLSLSTLFAVLMLHTGVYAIGFRPAVNYDVGTGAVAIVKSDFNHDGYLDLAVVNRDSDSVSILLGNGDGSFRAGGNFAVAHTPRSIALGDFNRDGNLDLAVASECATSACVNGAVSLLFGNGDGTFQEPAVTLNAGPTSVFVLAIDFNADGKLDLAVANGNLGESSGSISVFLGNGDGTFSSPATYNVGTTAGPVSLASGDLNGDGKPDLVAAVNWDGGYGAMAVLLNNGSGGFSPAVNYQTTAAGSVSVAVADLNGDGKLDVVVAQSEFYLNIFFGNGDGTFGAPAELFGGSQPAFVRVADINGDGNPDLLITCLAGGINGNGTVGVLLGNGDGTFQSVFNFAADINPTALVVGRFNADKFVDIAAVNETSNDVSVLLNSGLHLPNAVLSAMKLSFTTPVGTTSSSKTVTVSNTGVGTLNLSSITISGAIGAFPESSTCTANVPPGASCSFTVSFRPRFTGTVRARITLIDNSGTGVQVIRLVGTGT